MQVPKFIFVPINSFHSHADGTTHEGEAAPAETPAAPAVDPAAPAAEPAAPAEAPAQ